VPVTPNCIGKIPSILESKYPDNSGPILIRKPAKIPGQKTTIRGPNDGEITQLMVFFQAVNP
jgi:hypothetical protein